MAYLPLANILHHKLRSALSALGIGIGVCMLLTLAGLSRGSINEAIGRWNSVRADLIAYPGSANLTMAFGSAITLRAGQRILELDDADGRAIARRVAPAYLGRFELAGADQNIFGIRAGDFDVFGGPGRVLQGRLPDDEGAFEAWIRGRFAAAAEAGEVVAIPDEQLAAAGAFEAAIDDRLARRLGKGVGEEVSLAGRSWRIVGVFRAGAIGRIFVPMAALQYLASSQLDRATLLFVQLGDGQDAARAIARIHDATRLAVVPRSEYQAMLMQNFALMYTYVDVVNALALTIAFLFIMVTLYTMVLQRTREIAILKSLGASRWYLVRQVLAESGLLTALGAAMGTAGAFAAGWAIEQVRPDLAVTITPAWLAIALAAAGAGALAAGVYPAWRAAKVDVAEALTFE